MENNLVSILDEIKTLVNLRRDACVDPIYIETEIPFYISKILAINSGKITDYSEKHKYFEIALTNMFLAGKKCGNNK